MNVNDFVTILTEKENSVNRRARVVDVLKNGDIRVTNMNMPFMGTFCYKLIKKGCYEEVVSDRKASN
jgi:hypothetical protein